MHTPRTNRRSHAPVGLEVLDALAQNPPGLGVTELSRAIGLEVAQTHRTIRELVREGWVAQDEPNGTYRLTGGLLALAAKHLRHIELREVALPILRHLKRQTSETVVLAEFHAGKLYCVARELSDAPVINWAQIGDSWPLGSAAAVSVALEAAVLSSGQPELLPADYRPSGTRMAELQVVAQRGWSVDEGQYRPRGCAVGAAIFDFESRPVGAVAIAWPCDGTAAGQFDEFGGMASGAAREISSALGFRQRGPRAPWQLISEAHDEDLFRHLADLRAKTYEGAASRVAQESTFQDAARLLSPVVEEVLRSVNDRLLLGSGRITRTEADSNAEGKEVSWSLSWPEQVSATKKATGEPLDPVSVVARLRPSHLHGHLGGSYFGDWPMQILTPEDARRQAPIVAVIVEAELHQRVFEAGGNWRLVPAYPQRVGEPAAVDSSSESNQANQ